MGTVTDVYGDVIPDATVVLKEVESNDPRTILTPENGMFEFRDLTPGITYQLSISAKDYEDWISAPIVLNPDKFKIVTGIQLRIAPFRIIVDVHYDRAKAATEQFKAEEKQRVFRFIPNVYVSYESDPAPLTAKMKFKLALILWIQSGLSSDGRKDPKAFWMTEEHMRSAEHQVKTAGLKLITKPYIGDVAREISRPR